MPSKEWIILNEFRIMHKEAAVLCCKVLLLCCSVGSETCRSGVGLRLAQLENPTGTVSVLFLRFLPEEGSGFQRPKRCSFVIL
jgi:hypothetical protein